MRFVNHNGGHMEPEGRSLRRYLSSLEDLGNIPDIPVISLFHYFIKI